MNLPSHHWREMPLLRQLHEQWWIRRGGRIGECQRAFSCDWEELLEEAGWLTAEQRRETEQDARQLAANGWVVLKPVKFRPRLISRIIVPLEAEERLAELFGDPMGDEAPEKCLEGIAWAPELAFLSSTRAGVEPEDLLKLNAFFTQGGREHPMIPIKERSLQIFGDEKRLDGLLSSSLFRPGHLRLEQLRCWVVGEPLGWRRGPAGTSDQPLLIIENAATWHSYCRWNEERALFGAVVYGKGFNVLASVTYLEDVFSELGGHRPLFYFGDLDPTGLLIPYQASLEAQRLGLPPIAPHGWSYRKLLELGKGKESEWDGPAADEQSLRWLDILEAPARQLFGRRMRLAQEHLGWEWLSTQTDGAGASNNSEGTA
jgi:hypothetical protein